MKLLILLLVSFCSMAHAQTPWARDCVTWYGASIPEEKRTAENCPSGTSHWDKPTHTGVVVPQPVTRTVTTPQTSSRTQVITNSGSYLITQQPGTVFILQTAK
jgi:hypothetical protein